VVFVIPKLLPHVKRFFSTSYVVTHPDIAADASLCTSTIFFGNYFNCFLFCRSTTGDNSQFLLRDVMLARYMLWRCLCPSVRHNPVFYQNGWTYHYKATPHDGAVTLVFWR